MLLTLKEENLILSCKEIDQSGADSTSNNHYLNKFVSVLFFPKQVIFSWMALNFYVRRQTGYTVSNGRFHSKLLKFEKKAQFGKTKPFAKKKKL